MRHTISGAFFIDATNRGMVVHIGLCRVFFAHVADGLRVVTVSCTLSGPYGGYPPPFLVHVSACLLSDALSVYNFVQIIKGSTLAVAYPYLASSYRFFPTKSSAYCSAAQQSPGFDLKESRG